MQVTLKSWPNLLDHYSPQTVTAIQNYQGNLGDAYLNARQQYYSNLAAHDSTQQKFLEGWRNRLHHLRDYLTYLHGQLPRVPAPPTPPGNYADPLSIDLNRDGTINTLPLSSGIHFDLDNNGFAETTAWVAPNDGFLVLDKNANNKIDGGAELFGTETKLKNGNYAQNGFEALAEYDLNADGKIDSQDAIYSQLRVWTDANSNGITDANELKTLQELNIASLKVTYTSNISSDENSVQHREQSTVTYGDGSSTISQTLWFNADKQATVPTQILNGDGITISAAINALPDAKGFGNMYSLHQAMALDATGQLQAKVQAFVTLPFSKAA